MLIGILSDSHGRSMIVRRALALFEQLGAAHIIHCGDVGGMGVFDELIGRPCTFVWGNTDYADDGLFAYLKTTGLTPPADPPARLTLAGKRFAVFHGHERSFERAADLDADYILHGHTHIPRDDRLAGKRIINPGALHRAKIKTVATLDITTDSLQFHTLEG